MTPTWVFDLDNTLYPAGSGLFPAIDRRIHGYLVERVGIPEAEVDALRRRYWERYGVTLGGLLVEHEVDPEDYLSFVHDVPVGEFLRPDPALDRVLERLAGPKVIFTNGSTAHARNILGYLGVADRFEAIYDIEFTGYVPKPRPEGYHRMLDHLGLPARQCRMVDDLVANLDTARNLGMATILVGGEPVGPHGWAGSVLDLHSPRPEAGSDG